jgi:hypothetical protein
MRLPPKASAMACCPRHTPKILFVGAYSLISSNKIPASSGIPGPGERMILSYFPTSSR